MKKFIKKLIGKKNSGLGDLICSLFVILSLIILLFLSVNVVQDIDKVTQVDQIARQCIINLETAGELDCAGVKTQLENSGYTFADGDGVFVQYKDKSTDTWKDYCSDTKPAATDNYIGYGKEMLVEIKCKTPKTTFGGNIFGLGKDNVHKTNDSMRQIDKIKTSISKTAN